jgi:hypothetical protein
MLRRSPVSTEGVSESCETITRANRRSAETRTPEQHSGMIRHRTRHLCVEQTSLINALRAHLSDDLVDAHQELSTH